jgi:WD40 repeat protein
MTNMNRELITVGHTNSVLSLAFTSDGQTMISAGADRSAIWWDVETGKMRWHLKLSREACKVILSPDDSVLITDDGQVYDARTTRLVRTSSRYVVPYAFSSDGRMFACAAYVPQSDDMDILITDIRSGRTLRKLTFAGRPESMAFSSDNELLAVFGYEYSPDSDMMNSTTVFNLVTPKLSRQLNGEWVLLFGVRQSSSLRIAAVSVGRRKVWNAETGELLATLPEPEKGLRGFDESCTCVSHDGRLLATGSYRGVVSVYAINSAEVIWHSEPDFRFVSTRATAFTRDGSIVAAGGDDGAIRIWETATGKLKQTLGGRGEVVRKVVFEADAIKSMHYDGTARIWQISAPLLRKQDLTLTGEIENTFRRDQDFVLNLWRVGAANPVEQSEIPEGHYPVCISLNGSLLGLCRNNQSVAILNRETGTLHHTPPAALWRYALPNFSPDNRFLATSSEQGDAIRVFDTTTGELYFQIALDDPGGKELRLVVFSTTSRLLALGRDDSNVLLWDLKSRKLIRTLEARGEGIHAIAISPDEKHIAVAVYYSERVWVKSLARSGKDVLLVGHSADILSLDYSSDGSMIVTGGNDGTVRLWEAASGRLLTTYMVFPDSSWAIFTPDGEYTCSPGAERHLLWKVGDDLAPVTSEGLSTVPCAHQ